MKYLFYSVAFVCRIIFLACVGVVSGQRKTLKHLAQHASWNKFRVKHKIYVSALHSRQNVTLANLQDSEWMDTSEKLLVV